MLTTLTNESKANGLKTKTLKIGMKITTTEGMAGRITSIKRDRVVLDCGGFTIEISKTLAEIHAL